MPSARAVAGLLCSTVWPPTASVPESGVTAPVMTLMSVDCPAPFSPISACTSPGRSSKETDFSAWTPAYDLLISIASRMGRRSLDMDLLLCASRLRTQPQSQEYVETNGMCSVRRAQFRWNRVCCDVGSDPGLHVAKYPEIARVSAGLCA